MLKDFFGILDSMYCNFQWSVCKKAIAALFDSKADETITQVAWDVAQESCSVAVFECPRVWLNQYPLVAIGTAAVIGATAMYLCCQAQPRGHRLG